MHRIDSAGNVDGKFSNGNPQVGQRATVVSAEFMNAIQEEIAHVVEMSGLALDKQNNEQLYFAIVQIIASAIEGLSAGGGEGEGGLVPITRLVNSLGLLTGGGPLAGDLNLSVPKATALEIAGGANDTSAMTPAGLHNAALSHGLPNVLLLPGRRLIMTGAAIAAGNSTTVLTLPTTFPTVCLFAGCSGGSADSNAQDNNPFVQGRGVSSISVYNSRDSATAVNWFAYGY